MPAFGGTTIRVTRNAPASSSTPCAANGQAVPTANSSAPSGGPTRFCRVMKPPSTRALPRARSSRRTIAGSSVASALSPNTSATPSANSAASTSATSTERVTIAATSTPSTPNRTTAAATTTRRRSMRSVTTPATSPSANGGSHCSVAASATRNGDPASLATRSGPAASASPSPRFVVHAAASSQRKDEPRRAGATTSPSRLTAEHFTSRCGPPRLDAAHDASISPPRRSSVAP